MPSFTHLHVHSEYSLLDGLIRIPDLVRAAHAAGFEAIALTDHGVMFGVVRFFDEARQLGIKPIIGCELYVAPRHRTDREHERDRTPFHLTVLAESDTGYRNLLALASLAQLEGFYYKPRVDRELLERYGQGLIVLSGCVAGEAPIALRYGDGGRAREVLSWYRDAFPGRYYVELQQHDIDYLPEVNRQLVALARELDLPLAATNDVHYLQPADAEPHEVLLCLQTSTTVTDPDRLRYGKTFYLRSGAEMGRLFAELPEAVTNTAAIAERCNVDLGFDEYKLPVFPLPAGQTSTTFLRQLCEAGIGRRYQVAGEEVRRRLDHELAVIGQMGFEAYFLIVHDLCQYARQHGIWWNVRGSGAGSIVAYALGITNVDPLAHDLIFERFLNPARISMPDIDLDVADDQRDLLIRYAFEKYGSDRVAQIITFGTMGARAAIRDSGRALDMPLSEVDRLARMIPAIPGKPCTIDQVLSAKNADDEPSEFYNAELAAAHRNDPEARRLIDTARNLEGVARHASTHAAGVVIADRPIVEYVPLHRATHGASDEAALPVTQYAMNDIERLGLLKVDFLGLSTLTALRRAAELVARYHGRAIHLEDVPLDDPAIYDLLDSGNVTGVFQVEGAGMRRMLVDMQPRRFAHVVAAVALYRPGPMQFIPDYIHRLRGEEPASYLHPALEPILSETFGIIIYQEQIIRIARDLAGYDAGEADTIRKAVGKKNEAKLLEHRGAFVAGATQRGIARETAEDIFGLITKFARYGFNKAHAVDYATIVCQTAWFKAHYPLEYMTALLAVDRDDLAKVALLASDCQAMGITLLGPDVNRSEADFAVEAAPSPGSEAPYEPSGDGRESLSGGSDAGDEGAAGAAAARPRAIRFGLAAIKNVGEVPVQALVAARQDGPYLDLDDLCHRIDLRALGRRALESLVRAGALDRFGSRAGILEILDQMIALSSSHYQAAAVGQLSLFGGASAPARERLLPEVPDRPRDVRDELSWEKELTGLYLSEHPLHRVASTLPEAVTVWIGSIDESMAGQPVTLAGMVTAARRITTRQGSQMAFATLEDLQGSIEVTVFPKLFEATAELWAPDQLVIVRGRVEMRDERLQVVAAAAKAYSPEEDAHGEPQGAAGPPLAGPDRDAASYHLTISLPRTPDDRADVHRLAQVHQVLTNYEGSDTFVILVSHDGGPVEIEFPNTTTRYCLALAQRLEHLVGTGGLLVQHVAH